MHDDTKIKMHSPDIRQYLVIIKNWVTYQLSCLFNVFFAGISLPWFRCFNREENQFGLIFLETLSVNLKTFYAFVATAMVYADANSFSLQQKEMVMKYTNKMLWKIQRHHLLHKVCKLSDTIVIPDVSLSSSISVEGAYKSSSYTYWLSDAWYWVKMYNFW